jgi:hypothetical protein
VESSFFKGKRTRHDRFQTFHTRKQAEQNH